MLLPELIDRINELHDFYKTGDILKEYDGNDWKQYVEINSNVYNRKKIYENINYEIYIITWNVNQMAKKHDHAKNGCFLKILCGELQEIRYFKDDTSKINTLTLNDISYMSNNIGYHSIYNKNNEIAVTIHIYSPPNHNTLFM